MTDLLTDLEKRGLVAQMSSADELRTHLSGASRTFYCGFDPTADSLHIGSLVPLLALRRFQMAGHTPVALVGGATGLIGDPSFKAAERQLNDAATVEGWVGRIRAQVERFIDFDCGRNSARVVNNLDWIGCYDVLSFLRDIGKHFSVNMMIQKESVKARLEREESGISYTEFSYMILQSLDFAELYKRFGCTLQIGGSDQWGNITGGIDLVRRIHRGQAFGLTLPLVTKSDGTKFGKTESGTIWLSPEKTSPYAFYQFWINTTDADVYRYLKLFTFLSVEEIEAVEASDRNIQGRKQAQGLLASEVTQLVHGSEGLQAAQRISESLFSGDLSVLTEQDLEQLRLDGMPTSTMPVRDTSLLDALVMTGLAPSRKKAREFITGNAIHLNGDRVSQEDMDKPLAARTGFYQRYWVLRRGKRVFHLVCAN
jgi:tyrosyl-tRNA synthetase